MSKSPSMVRDLTRGPVVPLLIRFTLPLFVSNALQAIYNLVDGVFARVGLAALPGFALKMDCLGFWLGDAQAGFMPGRADGMSGKEGRNAAWTRIS